MSTFDSIEFGDYLTVTDEGGGTIRVDGCPPGGIGGIQFGESSTAPVYGSNNIGDWLDVVTTTRFGVDGTGIHFDAEDGPIFIESNNPAGGGHAGMNLNVTGVSNQGLNLTVEDGTSGIYINTNTSGSDAVPITIEQATSADILIENTGTGNVIAKASAGTNGNPTLSLIGNSNDAPIALFNSKNQLNMHAQSGISLENSGSGLSLLLRNHPSSYLSAANAEGVELANHIGLTAYTTEAAAPGAGGVRIYAYDDGGGSNNIHLKCVFSNGARTTIGTN